MPLEDTLAALDALVKAARCGRWAFERSAWGAMRYHATAKPGGPRMQRPERLQPDQPHLRAGLAEMAHREQVGLLAYSPLGRAISPASISGALPAESPAG